MVSKARAALSGVAAAAVAMGVAELFSVWTGPRSAPLIAVDSAVIDASPEPAKQFAIDLFGVYDKAALLIGTAVLLAAYAAAVGLLARRNPAYGWAGIALFTAVGAFAALTRHNADWTAALPSLLGGAAALITLRWLLGPATPAAPSGEALGAAGGRPVPGAAGEALLGESVSSGGGSAQPSRMDDAPGGSAPLPRIDGAPGEAFGQAVPPGGVVAGRDGDGLRHVDGAAAGSSRRGEDGAFAATDSDAQVAGEPSGVDGGPWGSGAAQAGRRGLLVAFGLAGVAGVVGRFWASMRSVDVARAELTLPRPVETAPALPGEPEVKGLSSYVTSNKDFYTIDTAIVAPQVHPDTWELRIHGRVDRPFTINFAELTAMPMVERFITLACVSNPVGGDLIGNAKWLGIPVKGLLEKAGPQAGADQVVMRSADGWTCGAPTAALMDGRDALLAVGMNGEPLPVRHGFPVRMVVPGLYGYVSACKWITEIELTSFADYDAFWIENGWAEQGPIKTQSRIDVPRPGATVEAGEVIIAGVAWAQHRGITVVEVQVDDGPWEAVELAGTVSADTWRQWTHRWRATAGQHEISVRAADTTGQPQTDDIAAPFPDGATGYHRISVSVL